MDDPNANQTPTGQPMPPYGAPSGPPSYTPGPPQPGPQGYPLPPWQQGYQPQPGPGGYMPPPPMAQPKKRGPLVTIVVAVAVIALLVGGYFVFRSFLSGDVTDLQVGDCIDEPADPDATVTEVQHHPCNEAHDGEVIAVLTHPAGSTEAYPVISGFEDYITQECVPAFESYVGHDWETDTDLTMSYFHPTISGWADSDRGFTCYVVRIDDQKLTVSVRNLRESPLP